ncbi:MAG: hypothetical protein EHM45_20600 [Desulfobacteraceae bacterium]|nr:MAG: hypothetical protein EHM45_20600 [Desulfobacteraceae bacterium]
MKNPMLKKNAFLFLIFLSLAAAAYAVGPQDLVYMTEEYAPYNYTENGEAKGISVEVLKLVWKEMNCAPQEVKFYPWARSYNMVQTNKNHVLFAMSRTAAREEMFKWVGPLYVSKFYLYGLASKNIKLDTITDANKYKVGAIREDVAEQLLKAKGVTIANNAAEMDINMKMLEAGRLDLVAYSEDGFQKYLLDKKMDPAQFKSCFSIGEQGSYYAFQKDTPDALIKSFQDAFDKVKTAGKLTEIIKKHTK